ncbi:MAG: nitronate monooxygenase [Actinomycetota bacterium]|nr:nitronate monooxygenase [Actinomycetota bacterium]
MHNELCEKLGIEFPIFAFSHCRDVVAAVTNAGGMGVLGALAFTPEQLELEITWIEDQVKGRPYGVDVVIPASHVGSGIEEVGDLMPKLQDMVPQQTLEWIDEVLDELGVAPLPEGASTDDDAGSGGMMGGGLLGWTTATSAPQVEVALRHDISLLVNALGPPPKEVVDAAHDHGVMVAALVGRADQAEKQVAQGVDIVVAQGTEAGGHTGEIATMVLVPEVVERVSPTPVLAAGGIGSGKQMAAAMALGASGVWTGSIWLGVAESNTGPESMQRLFEASARDAVRSRSLTGKPARMLRNEWTMAWERDDCPGTLPMPLQFMATQKARARMARSRPELFAMPVGQIVGSMKQVRTTKQVVLDMVQEYIETVEKMSGGLAGE